MKKLRNIISLVAVCATAALFTGCGGDNDTVGGGNNTSNSPDSLSGRSYNLTDTGAGGTLTFDAAAMNYTLTQGGATETGTYTANRNGDVWVVNATDSTGAPSTVTLTFTGNGSGNYELVKNGQTTSGSFAADTTGGTSTSSGTTDGTSTSSGTTDGTSTSSGTTDGTSTSSGTTDGTSTSSGTTDGTSTSTGTTTGTTGTVPAPASLSSITVTTGPGGGIGEGTIYTVNLTGTTSGTFNAVNTSGDPMGSGTFTYTPNGNQATLYLDYADSNDFDNMTLIFTTQPGGGSNVFTGNQFVTDRTYDFNGTFTY